MSASPEQRLHNLGVGVPRLTLPSPGVDLRKWAVIACDQHTSEPEYWQQVESIVGDSPSTLRLVFPEVYLSQPDARSREERARAVMAEYVRAGLVREHEPGLMLTERRTSHVSQRRGLLLALDLERYDFRPGATGIIRSTEQTIVDRLPPRVRIRNGAVLEVPHVLVLIDDPDDLVFGSVQRSEHNRLYSTELMLGGGSVAGYHVSGTALGPVADAFEELYRRVGGENPFLFAVGDGNHSLAAAKQVWEDMKGSAGEDHPARYALVEVVNLYDPGLRVEPIHRLVTVADADEWLHGFADAWAVADERCAVENLHSLVNDTRDRVGYVTRRSSGVLTLDTGGELAVTKVQNYLNTEDTVDVDYIHGWDTSTELGGRKGNAALLLPAFDPATLFPTVARNGTLPRKAFSLGEADEKRYYLEARRISR